MRFSILLKGLALAGTAIAEKQYPLYFDNSDFLKDANVTYKTVPGDICGGTDSYSGYANFPPHSMVGVDHSYPIHSFFWYFRAKESPYTAPLVIWLSGGPGASSMFATFTENGPCHVNPDLTTSENPWSWNQKYNLLYLDQPVQTGFSYDVKTNGTLDLTTGEITPSDPVHPTPPGPAIIPGLFGSTNPSWTANTTSNAARHFWSFLQVWLRDFHVHDTTDRSLSIWTESYGGRYGPGFAAYIEQQNKEISSGLLAGAQRINLTTLGIVNGCVDLLTQIITRPEFAYDRNPYRIQGVTQENFSDSLIAYSEKDGCRDRILACLFLAEKNDPGMYGNDTETNSACEDASDFCQNEVEGPYQFRKQWAFYDITHCYLDPFPENYFVDYLAKEEVRNALGVPVNYTDISNAVGKAFNLTGDFTRRDSSGALQDIASLLDSNITVAMMYGDRDFACNWIGGERASLGVDYANSDVFRQAEYADVFKSTDAFKKTGSPVGQVRQHGRFSFARVYQSGHMVPASQPEVAYSILERVMTGKDVATGQHAVDDEYSTVGTWNSTTMLPIETPPSPKCYLRAMPGTCAPVQIDAVKSGTAKVKDGIVIDPKFPDDICPSVQGH